MPWRRVEVTAVGYFYRWTADSREKRDITMRRFFASVGFCVFYFCLGWTNGYAAAPFFFAVGCDCFFLYSILEAGLPGNDSPVSVYGICWRNSDSNGSQWGGATRIFISKRVGEVKSWLRHGEERRFIVPAGLLYIR